MKYLLALLFSFPSLFAFSQSAASTLNPLQRLFSPANYPQDYFRNPLDIPMSLAANFGELRPNHYHMGLDIRTQHRENLPVYAAADGYVARVEIQPAGFGQAIYIRHPNGYTTVYGHLNQFYPALAAYVHEQQYRQQSWQVDLAIPPALFPVKKGEFIAYSGSTGGSQGPHLHFEIRLTAGDINLNPLLFGLPVPDRTPPTILRLAWYDRSLGIYEQSPHILPVRKVAAPHAGVAARTAAASPAAARTAAASRTMTGTPASANPATATAATGTPATADWSISPSLLVVPAATVSFALSAFDSQSGSSNPNGIYGTELYLDNDPVIAFRMDSISYDHTRNINAHIDYKTRQTGGPFLQQLFFLSGYPAPSIYRSIVLPDDAAPGSSDPAGAAHPANGVLYLHDGRVHDIRIAVKDTYGNTSSLQFQVQYRPGPVATSGPVPVAGKKFYPGMVDGLETDDCAFYLGEKSLYDSVTIDAAVSGYPRSGLSLPGGVSAAYSIGAPWIPLLDPVLVRLRLTGKLSPGVGDRPPVADGAPPAAAGTPPIAVRSVVMVCFQGSEKDVKQPEWKDGWASARFREFGNFQLVEDTIAPVITPIGPLEGADLAHASRIAFNIKDNLGALRNFRAELDGAWLCFTNDKGLAYIYTFDEHCPQGRHTLKVSVEDVAGNRTVKAYTFTR